MIHVSYDPRADALYIRFREAAVDESDEVRAGVIMDYDRKGKPIGIEVLDASKIIGADLNLLIDLVPTELSSKRAH